MGEDGRNHSEALPHVAAWVGLVMLSVGLWRVAPELMLCVIGGFFFVFGLTAALQSRGE